MLILKEIDLAEPRREKLLPLLENAKAKIDQVPGLHLRGFYSLLGKGNYAFLLETEDFANYVTWLRICPPPPGVTATHEIMLTLEEAGIEG